MNVYRKTSLLYTLNSMIGWTSLLISTFACPQRNKDNVHKKHKTIARKILHEKGYELGK